MLLWLLACEAISTWRPSVLLDPVTVEQPIGLEDTGCWLELEEAVLGFGAVTSEVGGLGGSAWDLAEGPFTLGQVAADAHSTGPIAVLTAHYGAPIVLSESTRRLVQDEGFALQELDVVVLKGKNKPMGAYEVLSGEPDPGLRRTKEHSGPTYAQALAAFRAGDIAAARALFASLDPTWRAAALFVERCDWFSAHGLPDDFDGVVRMTVK